MINWKVRARNIHFWLALIPALLLAAECIAGVFGWQLVLTGVQEKLLDAVNAVFGLLAVLGIVNDPTTAGLHDSSLAMTYGEPYGGEKQ